jgi:hypothetical protein
MLNYINAGTVSVYESHFGLVWRTDSPWLKNLCVTRATGPADTEYLFIDSRPPEDDAIRPLVRIRPLDTPATTTLAFSAVFAAENSLKRLSAQWAAIGFTDGTGQGTFRSLLDEGFEGKTVWKDVFAGIPSGWHVTGQWSGRIEPGSSPPAIRFEAPVGSEIRLQSYFEHSERSVAPFDLSSTIQSGGETWLRYREAEPLLSLWKRAEIGKAFLRTPESRDGETLIIDFDQKISQSEIENWPVSDGAGQILSATIEPNHVTAEVEIPAEGGFLLLRDSFAKGWTAESDGEPLRVLKAEGMFRAVALAPGIQTVTFIYWPPGLTVGICCAAAGVIGLFLVLLLTLRKRQPPIMKNTED